MTFRGISVWQDHGALVTLWFQGAVYKSIYLLTYNTREVNWAEHNIRKQLLEEKYFKSPAEEWQWFSRESIIRQNVTDTWHSSWEGPSSVSWQLASPGGHCQRSRELIDHVCQRHGQAVYAELCVPVSLLSVNGFKFVFSEWTRLKNSWAQNGVKVSKCDLLMNLVSVFLQGLPQLKVVKWHFTNTFSFLW